MDDPIQKLVEAARAGDPHAREDLLRQHLASVRAFVRLRLNADLRARESESDLVQSICREALGGLADFEYRGPGAFRAWLFTLAHNKLREKWRFHGAERRGQHHEEAALDRTDAPPAYGTLASPSEHAAGQEAEARLEAAFDRLSEDHREVILLSRIVGLPHAEIAVRMEKSELAVRSLLSRALVQLSAELEG